MGTAIKAIIWIVVSINTGPARGISATCSPVSNALKDSRRKGFESEDTLSVLPFGSDGKTIEV